MSTQLNHDVPTRPRAGTVVWGVVLTLTGLAVLAIGLGLEVDVQITLIVLLTIAGVGLLLKALVRRPAEEGRGFDDGADDGHL